ncbi:hypothetical protein SCE1572_19800 [Sorangium cellulosum So0157-2]|uniref:Uncharacterized protein n=1 Tax=Sorangium cellulosum So0157-2 TaxID=1254432 RepID=S4XW28_SORCE|nr:hypothetical protein SCE1572_19800 [Sorangium cellulosum So0157-2]
MRADRELVQEKVSQDGGLVRIGESASVPGALNAA